mmetsp:Transcript_9079/g.19474  ORF Transcript_9079/g.19474 Transcript_9079/m.19474 type:complete len:214 (-) Transcript_9079:659-1300(-)
MCFSAASLLPHLFRALIEQLLWSHIVLAPHDEETLHLSLLPAVTWRRRIRAPFQHQRGHDSQSSESKYPHHPRMVLLCYMYFLHSCGHHRDKLTRLRRRDQHVVLGSLLPCIPLLWRLARSIVSLLLLFPFLHLRRHCQHMYPPPPHHHHHHYQPYHLNLLIPSLRPSPLAYPVSPEAIHTACQPFQTAHRPCLGPAIVVHLRIPTFASPLSS